MPDNTGQVQEEYLNKLSQLEGKIAGDTFVASFSKNCEVLKSMCGLALVYENRMKQYTKEMKSILTDLKQAGGFRLEYSLIGAPCCCQCHESEENASQAAEGGQEPKAKEARTKEAETQTEAQQSTDFIPPEGSKLTVADMVTQAAQEMCPAGAGGDYVYNDQYHMFFSQSTGYYWDPKTKLFYQPTTGTYYSYDEDTQSYTVVEPPGASGKDRKDKDRRRRSRSRDRRRRRSRSRGNSREREHQQQQQRRRRRSRSRPSKRLPSPTSPRGGRGNRDVGRDDDGAAGGSPRDQRRSPPRKSRRSERSADEGELITEEEGSIEMAILSEDEDSNAITNYPPCIRFVVKQSQQLPPHSVQMLPFPGGVLGAPLKSDLCVPDAGIGKRHCNIYFESDSQQYKVEQLDGNNPTKINGKPLKKGAKHVLVHMDRFELGEGTQLEVHLHDRKDTCGNCEPGLLQRRAELDAPSPNSSANASSLSSEAQRRRNLKGLKKQYGLAEEPYIEPWLDDNPQYADRAGERRARVGSDFPHELDAAPAHAEVPMERSNKGFKMLQGMGWREGEGLGRSNQGGTQPVPVQMRNERAGIGSEDAIHSDDNNRGERWKRARARYDQIK
ncbi:angiogenic factor with G patch and FHA domains 1-like isoform X2 [Varroa jacobsoni]|nr:angiogenic factor with G patch and FHA domains 1-like isoform X2 [Varroa destructor]XP_022672226.1 angiogenic factor with G patch and FHA domains 1-like isoform X2 [Varroa destructor]XP_022694447.1 angiogenic factor with G patch and FHA domains 1-like isoform X2 [Varroa jacobsoni]